ncbi:hypothetical protein U1Q18_052336 [Sarracenia purpurea var. burkii]
MASSQISQHSNVDGDRLPGYAAARRSSPLSDMGDGHRKSNASARLPWKIGRGLAISLARRAVSHRMKFVVRVTRGPKEGEERRQCPVSGGFFYLFNFSWRKTAAIGARRVREGWRRAACSRADSGR